MGKTIIISNRLPVKINDENGNYSFTASEGGLATGLGSVYPQGNNVWIGWPGLEISEAGQQHEIKTRLAKKNLLPVFLNQEEINQYYEGFSNEMLWPIFHYMSTYARYEQSYWDYYKQVNLKFKEAVLEVAEAGDVIWIHDYQLLLLAGMIRAELPDIPIGFFLHIPFPSYELFRLIPWRSELLEGMLGADLIGFHTFDDARHFMSAASRILPVHSSANMLTFNDRAIIVESFPMGIDNEKFQSMVNDEKVAPYVKGLRESFSDITMMLSIDRLDYSKGIVQRLQAVDLLFTEHPEYIEKIALYMIVVPSRDTVPQYRDLRDEIDMLVGNINARYRTLNWHPIHYFYRSFPIEVLSALYQVASVCLITPMRDGMNLVSKEYVATRTNNKGVLILSEMAGASKELLDAIIVNPNNIGAVCSAIVEALNMPEAEQERRMSQMREVVSKFNVKHWVKIFMNSLHDVKQLQQNMQAKHVSRNTEQKIRDLYAGTKQRIIFLDYDGTLVGFKTNIDMASPDEELYRLLQQLSSDPFNRIVLVSGRKHQTMEEWFGHLHLDMISEHGAWEKQFNQGWQRLPGLTDVWKKDVFPVLEKYIDRTPGSFIEEKSYSLVWHYRKVEEGLGELRANELLDNLRYVTLDKGLQLLRGDKVLEIKSMDINKGKAASTWLERQKFDFIMALGDDYTDEDIFRVLPGTAITIKVGSSVSAARYYLRNYIEVRSLLKGLPLSDSEKSINSFIKI